MAISWRTCARLGMAAGGFAAVLAAAARAQSTWDGGGADNNWGTGANWANNLVPAFPTGLVFAGTARLTPSNNLPSPTVSGLSFDAGAGSFAVGGGAITVGATTLVGELTNNTLGANNGGVKQSSSSAQTVSVPMSLATGRHVFITDASTGNLTVSGAITREAGSNANFIVNGGNINTSLVNGPTGIIGAWATTGTDPTLSSWAARDASGNIVPYTAFSHTFDSAAGFPAAGVTAASNVKYLGGGAITFPAAATMNTFLFTEQTATINTMTVTDTLTFGNGGGIFRTGDIAAQHVITGGTSMTAGTTGPATLVLRTRTSAAPDPGIGPPEALNILTPITDNAGGGPVSVVKTGFGVMRLSSPTGNTFTGGLYVNEGQLRPTTVGALGAATSPIYVADGAQVLINTSSDIPNPWFIKGYGPQEQGNLPGEFRGGAFRLNNNASTISGTVTLLGDASIGARSGQATTADGSVITGKITGPYSLRLNRQANQGAAGLDANMPTFTLANSGNDWTGNTSIGGGRIRIGGTGEVIPDGAGKGNVELVGETTATGANTILNLNGKGETVNGLSSSGTENLIFITNSTASTVGTIRIGNNDATSTFGGAILDNTAVAGVMQVVKVGAGTLTLNSALNAWSGDTRVYNGKLSVASSDWTALPATSDVYVTNGATFDLAFTGTKLIDNLFFGATPQATGTWGSLTSTAAHKDARFTGTGLISVAALGTPLLAGDFDGNGKVEAADLTTWKAEFGKGGGGDADFDGDSDGNDYLVWQRQLGKTSPPTAAVPEPGSLALLGLAALGLAAANRKRT